MTAFLSHTVPIRTSILLQLQSLSSWALPSVSLWDLNFTPFLCWISYFLYSMSLTLPLLEQVLQELLLKVHRVYEREGFWRPWRSIKVQVLNQQLKSIIPLSRLLSINTICKMPFCLIPLSKHSLPGYLVFFGPQRLLGAGWSSRASSLVGTRASWLYQDWKLASHWAEV